MSGRIGENNYIGKIDVKEKREGGKDWNKEMGKGRSQKGTPAVCSYEERARKRG
jgi:hypothetical protein